MPWLSEAKKDVTSCDKQRGGANIRYIRWFPNGATHYNEDVVPVVIRGANPENWNILVPGGKENKSDSLSSGDRTGNSPNRCRFGDNGVEGPVILIRIWNGICLESQTIEGESPVHVSINNIIGILSRSGHEKSWLKLPGPSGKAKYFWETDSEPVPWGKGEKYPEQGSEIVPETVRLQPVGAILRSGDGVPFA